MRIEAYSLTFTIISIASRFAFWILYEVIRGTEEFSNKDLFVLKIFAILLLVNGFQLIFKMIGFMSNSGKDVIHKNHEFQISEFRKLTLRQRKISLILGCLSLVGMFLIILFEKDGFTQKLIFCSSLLSLILLFYASKYAVYKKLTPDYKKE